MNDEAMVCWIDLGHAVVVALEVQPARCNDAFERFKRRPRDAIASEIAISADVAQRACFEL